MLIGESGCSGPGCATCGSADETFTSIGATRSPNLATGTCSRGVKASKLLRFWLAESAAAATFEATELTGAGPGSPPFVVKLGALASASETGSEANPLLLSLSACVTKPASISILPSAYA